jgi:hypothetical protein
VREETPWCVAPLKCVEMVKGLSLLWVAKGARTKGLSSAVEAAEPSWVSLATKDFAVVDVLALWILVGRTPFPAPCVSSVRRISCLNLRPAPEVAVCASDFYPLISLSESTPASESFVFFIRPTDAERLSEPTPLFWPWVGSDFADDELASGFLSCD